MATLKERPLKSLVFDQEWVDRQDRRGKRLVVPTLKRESWARLSAALDKSSVMCSQMEYIQFPERDHPSVAQVAMEGQDACARLDLFDCNTLIEFDRMKLHPDRPMKAVVRGHPACTGSFANGTPAQIVGDYIEVV